MKIFPSLLDPLLMLSDYANGLFFLSAPYIALSGAVYCGYISCVTYGFYAVVQMLGPEESEKIFWDSPDWGWRFYVGLPLIPVGLIATCFPSLENILPLLPVLVLPNRSLVLNFPPSPAAIISALPWIRIAYKLALRNLFDWVLSASRSSTQDGQLQTPDEDEGQALSTFPVNRPFSIQAVVGALLMPAISSLVGSFFSGVVKSTFHRNILGGCIFIFAKDAISLLVTLLRQRRRGQRRIRSFEAE